MNYLNYHGENTLSNYIFLITGGAGFIGSNLVEYLVKNNAKKIIILDNLSTGSFDNIIHFVNNRDVVFIEGDIRAYDVCQNACKNVDYVLHQAALGSVPRSIEDPLTTNEVNITGFLNILNASKEAKVKRLVYAASSSTYGDSNILPKVENIIGNPLSPYAVTKYVNELYASVFSSIYNFNTIGLRYFNVFGPKQNLNGPYAAVIPKFIDAIIKDQSPVINGDGLTTRDFTFITNVVQANIKSLFYRELRSHNVYNVACGEQNSLLDLVREVNRSLLKEIGPIFNKSRVGDIKHSLADISKAKQDLGFLPEVLFKEGIKLTTAFYLNKY